MNSIVQNLNYLAFPPTGAWLHHVCWENSWDNWICHLGRANSISSQKYQSIHRRCNTIESKFFLWEMGLKLLRSNKKSRYGNLKKLRKPQSENSKKKTQWRHFPKKEKNLAKKLNFECLLSGWYYLFCHFSYT